MIINMVGGGGGAALNFKVVPGLTQPGTASENTIWVEVERIGAWYFSATQPEGLQEWDVWFPTGTESNVKFNALRKNGLQVYPLSAKQYVSGALVDKPSKIYQSGEWVDLTMYLWKEREGALSPFTTPAAYKYPSHNTNMVIGDTLSIANDYIGAYHWGVPIENFPSVNTIFAEVSNVKYHTADAGDWQLKMSISDSQDYTSVDRVNAKCYTVIPDSVAKQIVKLDIPEGMKGYFAIGGWGAITIHNVWTG